MSHRIHNTDTWAAVAWWSEFPELSKLWATGNRWLHSVVAVAPELKIVGCCDPLVFNFTKMAHLDISRDKGCDLTTLFQPLPVTIKSLTLYLPLHLQRTLVASDFPTQLIELTISTPKTCIDISILPQTLTSLTVIDSWPPPDLTNFSLTNVVNYLPELKTLILPNPETITMLFSSDLLRSLPPSLTRFQTSSLTPEIADLSYIPATITELNLKWFTYHFPHFHQLPCQLTSLIISSPTSVVAEHINMLPVSITSLSVTYIGADIHCFERLPLRKWKLTIVAGILDFHGNFPQLSYLKISGVPESGAAKTVCVPPTVKVFHIHTSCRELILPPELRLHKITCENSNNVKDQLRECVSYINTVATLASISDVAARLMTLTPACLTVLNISISAALSVPETMGQLLLFINLKDLTVNGRVTDTRNVIPKYVEHIMLPASLTRLNITGMWDLQKLELPPSLIYLYIRYLTVPHTVLFPLQKLRTLSISFNTFRSWSLEEIVAVLDQLPSRMRFIHICYSKFSKELDVFAKGYLAGRKRYLVDFEIIKPLWC